MGRKVERLSPRAVKTKGPGYWPDGGNLFLAVTPSKVPGAEHSRSWLFCYTLRGRSREMGLGSCHTVGLSAARAKARECRALLLEGRDPLAEREAKRSEIALAAARTITFSQCAEKYIDAHRAGWRNAKHAWQWSRTLEMYAFPVIGRMAVADVDTGAVARVLERIWSQKSVTAGRLRGRIEAILDWARVRGFRAGDNPARWRGHLEALLPKSSAVAAVEHHAALSYAGIGTFMTELRAQEGVAARALEFTILTCARTSEVIGARPDEFDLSRALWIVPASRMKMRREHRVPLSVRAVEIVRAQIKSAGEYVFPGTRKGRPLAHTAMLKVLERMGRDSLTVHGFRSTFRDWAAEATAYPHELAEMSLAHAVSDKVEAAYRRGDMFEKRRRLAADWARWCERATTKGKVTPIRSSTRAAPG